MGKARTVVWEPSPRQVAALESPVLDLFYGGGRGGGKTDFLLADWTQAAALQPGCTGLLVRRTLPELDDVQRRAMELYPRIGATYKAAPREWHMPGGAILRMRYLESLQDASRYQGHQYQWIGVDEAGNYQKPEVIDLLRGCLRTNHPGWVCYLRLTGNPGGPGHDWLKARYITPAPAGQPHTDPETGIERVFVMSLLADNPHIQDKGAYTKNLQGAGPPHLVRAWLHGDWDVLPNGGVLNPDRINNGKPPEHLARRYLTVDGALTEEAVGRGDQTSATVWALDGDPDRAYADVRHWILHQAAERWGVGEAADRVLDLAEAWEVAAIWIEGGPPGRALLSILNERMRASGRWFRVALTSNAGDKVSKAAPLAALIDAGKVHADKSAAWWPALRDQFTVFDGQDGKPDDRVDSAGIAPRELRRLAGNKEPAPAAPPPDPRKGLAMLGSVTKKGNAREEAPGLGSRSSIRRTLG